MVGVCVCHYYNAGGTFCQADIAADFTGIFLFYRILWVACLCEMLYNGNRSVHFHTHSTSGSSFIPSLLCHPTSLKRKEPDHEIKTYRIPKTTPTTDHRLSCCSASAAFPTRVCPHIRTGRAGTFSSGNTRRAVQHGSCLYRRCPMPV